MKKFLLVINTILIIVVIGFTGIITIGFFVGDKSDVKSWIVFLGFSGLILFPLIIWRKYLKKSNTPKTTQSDTLQSSLKKEDVETNKSDDSILDEQKISEPQKEEFESEDKEKMLSDFIELCLLEVN